MTDLVTEVLGYIAVAALLGFLLGWLTWGWGQRDRIFEARSEGALNARTSVDGDAGLRERLQAAADERARLGREIDRLTRRLAAAELAAASSAADDEEGAADDMPDPEVGPSLPAAGTDADRVPAMPQPPAFTLRRQRAAEAEEPPVVDEQVPPGEGDDAEAGMPRPTEFTLRRQRISRADELSAVKEQAPPLDGGTGEAEMPQPPAFTLRRQRAAAAGEPPVVDEQVPPGSGDDAEAGMPRPAEFTLRRQKITQDGEPPVSDEQVPPRSMEQGAGMSQPAKPALRVQSTSGAADGEPPVIDEQVPPDGVTGEFAVAEPRGGAPLSADAQAPGPPSAPASLLSDRPAKTDDLSRISGVDGVTERKLNENGIWLFRQMAALTPAEMAWLAEAVDVPESRVQQERWVEQARALIGDKDRGARDGAGD